MSIHKEDDKWVGDYNSEKPKAPRVSLDKLETIRQSAIDRYRASLREKIKERIGLQTELIEKLKESYNPIDEYQRDMTESDRRELDWVLSILDEQTEKI